MKAAAQPELAGDPRPPWDAKAGLLPHFLEEARQELTRYKSVSVRGTRVTDISLPAEAFEFVCADGTSGIASKVLLATGIVDELPELQESSLCTAFRSIIASTAMASNMPANRWPPRQRG